MQQFGGKNAKNTSSSSKRHFTVVMGKKEHGLYVSSFPSSAAKKAETKLCVSNKGKEVEFHIREITQGSKKKTYGPYLGYIEKLKEPIELKSHIIKYKPVAKLIEKKSAKKRVMKGGNPSKLLDEIDTFISKADNPEKTQEGLQKLEGWINRIDEESTKIIKELTELKDKESKNKESKNKDSKYKDSNDYRDKIVYLGNFIGILVFLNSSYRKLLNPEVLNRLKEVHDRIWLKYRSNNNI